MKACDLPDMTSELSVAKNSKCDHSQAVQVVKRLQNKKYRVLLRFSFFCQPATTQVEIVLRGSWKRNLFVQNA